MQRKKPIGLGLGIVKDIQDMATATALQDTPDVSADNYLVVGLATCFLKQEGEVEEVKILEPIPSAALEAILKGIPTSYSMARGTTLGEVISGDTPEKPPEFPAEAHFCDDFIVRAIASARTYKTRPEAQAHIPPGTTRNDFNYSIERKRLLNQVRVVRKEDDVKQHEYTHKVL